MLSKEGVRFMDNQLMNPLICDVKNILDTARSNVAREVNNELVVAYWKIGEINVSIMIVFILMSLMILV